MTEIGLPHLDKGGVVSFSSNIPYTAWDLCQVGGGRSAWGLSYLGHHHNNKKLNLRLPACSQTDAITCSM